ncbi:glutamate receptor ionotropic, kainate 2-like [Anoplophora glabripennis]|uniref:glutamate receptor ionotropic, kainate 2-like n=1 Tax=Anoplophora glabripennis TaxID=217634 RepID=UPI000C79440C|nr:glutamate receptor ionotropic, kainate 2-like [Anoplophora glabripennis]
MLNIMVLLLFLVCLLAQDAFCNNITYRYTIGLLHENGLKRERIDDTALAASSKEFQIHVEPLHIEPDDAFECLNSTCHFILRYPTVAIFGPTSKINVDAIQSLCSARNIPHVLTDYVDSLHGDTQINFYPHIDLLMNAYMDILSSMDWNQFTFVYTSRYHTPWIKFIEKAQSQGYVFDTEFIDLNFDQERSIVQKLKNTGKTYFVVDCLEKDTVNVLHLFQNFGMVTEGYHYFFTSIDTFNGSILNFKFSGAEIIRLQLVNSNAYEALLSKSWELSYLPTISEFLTFDAIEMLANALKSLKPVENESVNCEDGTQWEHGESVVKQIISSSYTGLTGPINFGSDRYRNTFTLFINELKPHDMVEIGIWNTSNGFKYTKPFSHEETVDDWKSNPLVVATSLTEPYAMEKQSASTLQGNDRYQGFAIDLIEEISKILNFTYIIVIGNATGRPDYGEWTGMIGDVLTKRADLIISDVTVTYERLGAVEFTLPIMYTGITILFQKPMATPPKLFDFAKPFSAGIWVAIVAAFVTVSISLFIVGRMCNSEWQKLNVTSKYSTSQLTFPNTVWFAAGSLFRQNTRVKIRSIPGRIIAATWWLLCLVVIAMYIAALICYREEDFDMLFSDVKSLVKNAKEHDIKYGAKKDGATMQFFGSSAEPLYQEIYQHMIENDEEMVSTIGDGVQMALDSRYAFLGEETTIDYITERYCQLTKYGGLINENSFGIAMRPGSPYLTAFNTAILRLTSMGKLEELKRKWWMQGNCASEEPEAAPLYVYNILDLIHLTLFGVALAAVSAIVELLLHVLKKSKKLNVGFSKILKLEVQQCFKRNTKSVIDRNLITKPVPENEDNGRTSEAIELS